MPHMLLHERSKLSRVFPLFLIDYSRNLEEEGRNKKQIREKRESETERNGTRVGSNSM